MVIYISGDNGPARGTTRGIGTGAICSMAGRNGRRVQAHLDEWGGRATYPHMSVGWAIAFDTPFAFTKQVAGDFGGTRNGTVIHWPAGIKASFLNSKPV